MEQISVLKIRLLPMAIRWNLYLHVKWQLYLGLKVAVVDFEEAMDEFSQVDVLILAQIENCKEPLPDDAR